MVKTSRFLHELHGPAIWMVIQDIDIEIANLLASPYFKTQGKLFFDIIVQKK